MEPKHFSSMRKTVWTTLWPQRELGASASRKKVQSTLHFPPGSTIPEVETEVAFTLSPSSLTRKCCVGSFWERIMLKSILGESHEQLWVEACGCTGIKNTILHCVLHLQNGKGWNEGSGSSLDDQEYIPCMSTLSGRNFLLWRSVTRTPVPQPASTGTAMLPLKKGNEVTTQSCPQFPQPLILKIHEGAWPRSQNW